MHKNNTSEVVVVGAVAFAGAGVMPSGTLEKGSSRKGAAGF